MASSAIKVNVRRAICRKRARTAATKQIRILAPTRTLEALLISQCEVEQSKLSAIALATAA
jgi:hypothetical protein